MFNTSEYRAWQAMKARCTNPMSRHFVDYGGRGITVCSEWLHSFEAFFAAMGEKPSGAHTLDRIDVNGPYSPDNCRWATNLEQQRNRRDNRYITHKGKTMCVSEWAEAIGLSRQTVLSRLRKNLPLDDVLDPELDKHQKQRRQITFEGKTMSIAEWSRHTGIGLSALYNRFHNGWPVERALTVGSCLAQ
jgi:hypothetical protein